MHITTPYRVCPLGAHIDHQNGPVTGFALDHGVRFDYSPLPGGDIRLVSPDFAGEARTTALRLVEREGHWGDYARAAVAALLHAKYELSVGFEGEIRGSLPIGGLSSSASVIITYLRALCSVNGIKLTAQRLIELAHWAETQYIGLNIGVLDQSCEVYSRKDHLLSLDTKYNAFELIPQAADMPRYKIAIIFSGVQRALINSAYNARVDECRAAAYALKAYEGMAYAGIAYTRLRDVPYDTYVRHRDKLPENWSKRACHYYTEVLRVQDGIEAWRKGDLHSFGRLMFESGDSSINSYESGSPELKALHRIARMTEGIYGGRFSGAGFKGCYVALVDPMFSERIQRTFNDEYLKEFPELRERFGIWLCESADGVGEMK